MKHRIVFINVPFLLLFLALAQNALASSTWYVDGVNGSDSNNCKSRQHACKTIGHAISLASSGDSVMLAAATYTENLTIDFSLKVIGSGATRTIINGGGVSTVVTISTANAHVTLSKVTITKGLANAGGGISNSGTLTISDSTVSGNVGSTVECRAHCFSGGGIFNDGTLTINRSTISGNAFQDKACLKFCLTEGGGIFNSGTSTINNSTVSGNDTFTSRCVAVCNNDGGGIKNDGSLTISNSTISGNTASVACQEYCSASGGGIYNSGTLTINNTTLSRNEAFTPGCVESCFIYGAGISNSSGTVTLQNSIVARNHGLMNCNGTMTSNGYNLSSDGSCNFHGAGDLNNTDPNLGTLGNYGGSTQTIPLLSGSPAIDAGNPSGCTDGHGHLLKTDQRGKPRPDKEDTSGCDMGAYERQSD